MARTLARLLRHAHGGEGVGGLAGLGDADDQIALAEDRVAVAELRGDVHVDGDTGPLLDRVAPDQAGVERGAAGHDHDAVHVAQQLLVERADVVEVDAVGAHRPVGDRLGHRVRLVVDLLEHERVVAALLGGLLVPVDLGDLTRPLDTVGAEDPGAFGADLDDLAVLQRLHVTGGGQEGGHGGGQERLPLAAADHQRALLPGADERPGVVDAHGHERVVALEVGEGAPHGLAQIAVVVVGDQVGDHLGVRLGREPRAVIDHALLERQVVLDDAVDDDVHAVGVVGVRVGVDLVDAPVGRPAGVGDAGRGGLGPVALLVDDESLLEVVEVAHRAHAGDLVVDHDGDAGRVVAAVFELAQAGEEKLLGGPRTDVADDAAHGRSPRS